MKQNKLIRFFVCSLVGVLSASFVFADDEPKDSTEEQQKDIIMWNYNLTHTARVRAGMDTSMDFFYMYEPNGQLADYKVNVAEYASPSWSLLYSPKSDYYPFFYGAYKDAIITTDKMPDYTAQCPYSNLIYTQGLNSEQSAKFTHTQNVNKYCNVGFDLNFYKTLGEWENQAIKGQHVTPWISYYGPRFTTTLKYAFNHINRQENGGIAEDSLLTYEKLRRMKHPYASSSLHFQDVEFMQKWNLGRKPKEDSTSLELLQYKNSIGYKLNYNSIKRSYFDQNLDTSFYQSILFDSLQTTDTVLYKNLSNSVFYELQRDLGKSTRFVANVGAGLEYMSTYFHDYTYSIPENFCRSTYYEGKFDLTLPYALSLSHAQKVYFEGEKSGSCEFYTNLLKEFSIKEKTLSIKLSHTNSKLDLQDAYYFNCTNHYAWSRYDLGTEKINDFALNVNSEWGNIEAGVHYYTMKDYVSFDENAVLQKADETGNALTAKIQKTTRFWHILMKNGLIYQDIAVGNQEYPTWATYNSLAFQGAFLRKLIHFGIGAEMLYYPAYKVPTYDGALGEFLPQSNFEYGDFPIVNVFATIKYKPIRLYVKYTSLYALVKEQNYPIAGYPQTNGTISFGISWVFYN